MKLSRKALSVALVWFALFATGCAHSPNASNPLPAVTAPQPGETMAAADPLKSSPPSVGAEASARGEAPDEYGDLDLSENAVEEKRPEIADPLEPFNRAMFQFNDRLYFWVLKPIAQGYGKVVPEPARVSIGHFFNNLAFPIRFVNCLLQANFSGAAAELGRFAMNTLWGIGGLLDPASSQDIQLPRQNGDLGQTLGSYGLGQGFFITWPLLGPSSLRDTLGMVGDGFLNPISYLGPWHATAGIKAYDKVNDLSLKIGDYEALIEAAIDPYVAIRDAYVQYRMKKLRQTAGETPAEVPGVNKP